MRAAGTRPDGRSRAGIHRLEAERLAGLGDAPGVMSIADMRLLGIDADAMHGAATFARLVETALAGGDAAASDRLAWARGLPERISLATLALLAHYRVDACAWLVLQRYVGNVALPGENMPNVSQEEPKAGLYDADFHLGRDVHHTVPMRGDGEDAPGHDEIERYLDMPLAMLPYALQAACVGRPIADVLSHPALDGFDAVVTAVTAHETHIEMHHDGLRRSIALADLTADLVHPAAGAIAAIHALDRRMADDEKRATLPLAA